MGQSRGCGWQGCLPGDGCAWVNGGCWRIQRAAEQPQWGKHNKQRTHGADLHGRWFSGERGVCDEREVGDRWLRQVAACGARGGFQPARGTRQRTSADGSGVNSLEQRGRNQPTQCTARSGVSSASVNGGRLGPGGADCAGCQKTSIRVFHGPNYSTALQQVLVVGAVVRRSWHFRQRSAARTLIKMVKYAGSPSI